MKHFSLSKIKTPEFTGLAVLLLLIYTSDDTMLFGTYGTSTYFTIKYIALVALTLFLLIKKTRVTKKSLTLLVILVFLFFFSAIVSGWFKIGFVYNLILLLAGLVYASGYPLSFFKEAFCKIMTFLSLYALIIYFVNLFAPGVLSVFPVMYNTSGNEFRNAIFSISFYSLQLRNFGLFREPGVFMIYLNTALFFEWFSEKASTKRLFLYILTLLTTVSTAGFLIGAIIFAGGALYRKQTKNVIIALPLVILAYYVLTQEDSIYGILLLGKVSDGGSGTAFVRMASFLIPMRLFTEYPLGTGPDLFNQLFPIFSASMYGEAFDGDLATATLFKMLAVYGILVFTFYFGAFISFIKKCYKNTYLRWLFFIVLFLALGNEDMRVSLLFNMMVAYGITFNDINRKNNEVVVG